ncbi:FAD-binding oxidoreductase [Alphaproteobacteria bacterium]|nr:FAD-binding oxidoreductase [Alphaproteobacteria bacterium]
MARNEINSNYDAIIIGAGVIGACTAFEMAKKGYRTLNIDKGPQAGYGSTSGSCAIIRTYYSTTASCALAYEGWFYWSNWADYLGVTDPEGMITYHNTGNLVIKTLHNNCMADVIAMMDEIGCPYEHLTLDQIADWLPGADTRAYAPAKQASADDFGVPTGPAIEGAVRFPRGGYVDDPKLSAHNAQYAAEMQGAHFKFNSAVTKIRQANGRVCGVTLDDGTQIDAPVVVNVAGPHSSIINEMAGVLDDMKITTRALRHEVAHVPAPSGERLGSVYSDSDIFTYARPATQDHILIGSEDPECDEQEWIDNPDEFDRNFSVQWKTLVMRLGQRMPGLPIPEQAKGVVELYDVTEDWAPIYDKSSLRGFYMACGTSGNQYKNAPVAGKMMTALIEACENGQDHDKDTVVFRLENVGYDLPLSAFSRNREINQNSSFSVLG